VRAAAFLVVPILIVPCVAMAQEITLVGPLSAAPALPRVRLWREGRVALSASGGIALRAGAPPQALLGTEAIYYPQDSIGAGAWAAAIGAHGPLRMVIAPEVVLVPIEGKLAFPLWLPYDLRIHLGGAWGASAEGGARAPWSMVGLGLTTFFASSWSCGLDLRGVAGGQGHAMTDLAVSLTYLPGERRDEEH
jgi:hypothetical protein